MPRHYRRLPTPTINVQYSQTIRVVECAEFRELLLYTCPEISDSDLAKQDKIHNTIVDAGVDYIEVLKKQLGVCYIFLKLLIIHTYLFSLPWAKSAIRQICGQKRTVEVLRHSIACS